MPLNLAAWLNCVALGIGMNINVRVLLECSGFKFGL
jgi:hypothetical protein